MREEIKELWPFYLYKFIRGVCFLTSITLFIFYQEKGLTYFQTSLAIALCSLISIIFEVITGAVADTFGRKKSVVLSLLLDSGIIFLIALATQYWQFLVLLALWGFSSTLASGADQAWAVDSLIEKKKEHLLDSYYAKTRVFFNAGILVAGALSGLILLYGTNQALWFVRSGLTVVIGVILLFFGKENFISKKEKSSFTATWKTTKEAYGFLRRSDPLRKLTLAWFFFMFAVYFAETSAAQEFKLAGGIALEIWGPLYIISTVIGIFLPLYSIKLSRKAKRRKNYLAFALLVMGLFYALAYYPGGVWYVAILSIIYVSADELYMAPEEKMYNKYIPSSHRATSISLKSMVENLGLLLGISAGGYATGMIGGASTIAMGGLFLIPAILLILMIKTDKK